ncbi:MAG TPA: zinc-dependent alcohol dehydrogenase [Candidatus Angelobacter sp.]|jgi:threonine dehydrogenase-like Zn-dependent dehydrogenase|nr:zinc-dependent alcohol dehydrogenase [Candidatus Angelobacter sp.]
MKAVVFRGIGDIRLEDVPEPKIQKPNDAIVRLTASAICGTDLHMIRGTMPGMVPGTILGHEGVGVVEEVGRAVRNFKPGDRVVIPSTIGCGNCSYCRAGYYSQCDAANPNGPAAGTAFYGGPATSGPFHGMQAEFVRVPFANINLVKLPDAVLDDEAILLSDIFPTGYMCADLAEIHPGSTVAVFGCGPVGQFAIASAKLLNAGRIFAIDAIPSRLEMAREQGAEIINFEQEDPLEAIRGFTGGIGVDRVLDCVGVDANRPHNGKSGLLRMFKSPRFKTEQSNATSFRENRKGGNWHPGDAPSRVLEWAVEALAKAGTFSIVGVYGEMVNTFPIGAAMEKNLTLKMGNCNHRKYIPKLLELVRSGVVDPTEVLTQVEPMEDVIEAYKQFDKRTPGWVKVMLEPESERKVA